jgi:hypothetical protein
MSRLELSQPSLCIPGTRISLFERAPLEYGRKRGFFRDETTRALLGLNKGDFMTASGTYGAKELAEYPVDFALVRDGSYDQRFLPFVPEGRGTMRRPQIELPLHNKQRKPSNRDIKGLKEDFLEAVSRAEKAATRINIPLPDYTFELVPRLCYQVTPDDLPFEYQFQCWFAPQAHYARWRRIERVTGLLEGYTNACYQFLHPGGSEWPCGKPIGFESNLTDADDGDRDLALAYSFLQIPILLPDSWIIPDDYTLQKAQAAILSDGRGSTTGHRSFIPIAELPGDDYDALEFSIVRPNYSEHRYNGDGTRLTKQQRKEHDEGESTDMVEDEGSEIGSIGDAPFPSDKIVEIMEDVQLTVVPTGGATSKNALPADSRDKEAPLADKSPLGEQPKDMQTASKQKADEPLGQPLDSLQLALPTSPDPGQGPALQLDTALGLIPPSSTSNPASASTSAPASAISSASSANLPSHHWSEASHRRGRAARRQNRASEYPGSSRPSPRPRAGKEAWEQYFEGQEARRVSYERPTSTRTAETSALAPRSLATEVGPVRTLPQFRVVNVQAQPLLLHDTASNQLVETAVLSTDFSKSALLQHALQQQQAPSRPNRSPPRERDRSPSRRSSHRDRSRRDYRQRSPSPEYRRRSPPPSYRDRSPPRERRQRSRRHSPSGNPNREPLRGPRGWPQEGQYPQDAAGAWGTESPADTESPLPGNTGNRPPVPKERRDASGSTSRRE